MKEIYFGVDFLAGYSNKLQKLGLKGKFSSALNVFTLGANSTGYTSLILFYNRRSKEVLLLEVPYVPKKLVMSQSIWLK